MRYNWSNNLPSPISFHIWISVFWNVLQTFEHLIFPPQFRIRELIWLVYLVCQLSVNLPDWVFKVVNGRAEVLLHPSRKQIFLFLEQQIFLFLRQSTNLFVLKKWFELISAFLTSLIICFWHKTFTLISQSIAAVCKKWLLHLHKITLWINIFL